MGWSHAGSKARSVDRANIQCHPSHHYGVINFSCTLTSQFKYNCFMECKSLNCSERRCKVRNQHGHVKSL